MRERFTRFMIGRNGNDQLNRFLLVAALVFLVAGVFFGAKVQAVFRLVAMALIVVIYFRMFSRNTARRREENGRFLRARYKFSAAVKIQREKWVQRRDYKFFTCPSCRTTLRVPRGKGKLKIVCRKCGNTFIGKS